MKGKREQEHQDLYWFTLHQGLHPISLPTSKESVLKSTNVQTIQPKTNPAPCKITPNTMQNHTTTYKSKPYTIVVPISHLINKIEKKTQLQSHQYKTSQRKHIAMTS